jgi:hypothetical protein
MGLKVENPNIGFTQFIKEAKSMMGAFGFNLDEAKGHFDKLQNSFSAPKKAISLPSSFDPRLISNWSPCIHAVRSQ